MWLRKPEMTKLSRTLITGHGVLVVDAFAVSPPEPGWRKISAPKKAESVLSIASRYYQQVANFFNNLQGISH
jgi:hypothetical protein